MLMQGDAAAACRRFRSMLAGGRTERSRGQLALHLVWVPPREIRRLHSEFVDDDGHQQVGVGHPQHCVHILRNAPGSIYVQLQTQRCVNVIR
jgi:hypothetical protein